MPSLMPRLKAQQMMLHQSVNVHALPARKKTVFILSMELMAKTST